VVKEFTASVDYLMTKVAADVLTRGLAKKLAPYILTLRRWRQQFAHPNSTGFAS